MLEKSGATGTQSGMSPPMRVSRRSREVMVEISVVMFTDCGGNACRRRGEEASLLGRRSNRAGREQAPDLSNETEDSDEL